MGNFAGCRAGFSCRAKSSCVFFLLWKFWDTCRWFILWIGICEMFLWFADVFGFGSFVFAAMSGRGEGTFISFSFLARTLGAAQPFRNDQRE